MSVVTVWSVDKQHHLRYKDWSTEHIYKWNKQEALLVFLFILNSFKLNL